MFPVLHTERLILREIVQADACALFAFRSDPEEQKHNDPPLRTLDEAHDLIARLDAERAHGALRWGLTLRGEDVVVGLVGYNFWSVPHARAGIGYDLTRSLWGRGLMSEAMTVVLDHGFGAMGLNRVEAHTNAGNAASVRMLRRLGFRLEGTLHEYFHEDGAYHDVALFAMLRRDRI